MSTQPGSPDSGDADPLEESTLLPAGRPENPPNFWGRLKATHGTGGRWVLACMLVVILLLGLVLSLTPAPDASRPYAMQQGSVWFWWSALVVLAILGVLFLVRSWWALPVAAVTTDSEPSPSRSDSAGTDANPGALPAAERWVLPRWFPWVLILAMAVGAWGRAPLLDDSFQSEEEIVFRQNVWGSYQMSGTGASEVLAFEKVDWSEALLHNPTGDAHVLPTVVSRASHAVWRGFSPEGDRSFSESAVRMVPFVAGLLTICSLGLLLALLGSPGAGAAAAFFLALNPWHLRYSMDIRGHSLAMLFLVLGLICLILLMRTGRWKWWGLQTLCSTFALLSHSEALVLVVFQAAAGIVLVLREPGRGDLDRSMLARRIGAGLLLVVSAFALASSPAGPGLVAEWSNRGAGESASAAGSAFEWTRDYWSLLTTGVPYEVESFRLHNGTSLMEESSRMPLLFWFVAVLAPIICLIGVIGLYRHSRQSRLVLLSLLAAIPFAVILDVSLFREAESGRVVASVLAVSLLMAWGTFFMFRGQSWVTTGNLATAVGIYAILTVEPRGWLMEFERQPARTLAQAVRGGDLVSADGKPGVMTAALETPRVSVKSYDPHARVVHDFTSWQKVLREARLSRRELYVYYAGYEQPRLALPKVMEHIGDPGAPEDEREFEFVSVVPGLEAERTFTIYRYRNPEIEKRG